ncbi:ComEC/Rec2 family competence protein [Castellaniella sp.]|uniref:ComEC/Rec2 family competence protein n=1 Tax=Castellaniella sp. TaxID=1955812 RepID=UPI002AFF1861|nr:ComEC/Rec2 family competence protein [Castellaniella sp.]
MIGRLAVGAGLLGVGAVHQLPELPAWTWPVAAVLVPAVMLVLAGFLRFWVGFRETDVRSADDATSQDGDSLRRGCSSPEGRSLLDRAPPLIHASFVLALWLLAAGLAFAVTVFWAQQRLDQVLADGNVDRVSRVVLRVQGLPRLQPDRIRFEADVLDAHPAGVPQRILVSWPASGWRSPYAAPHPADPPFPVVQAGQVWRMALVLRPIRAAQNTAAFDYEGHMFAAGIRASGTVRGVPEHLRDEGWHGITIVADRARHRIRQAMAPYLEDKRYGAVLRALAIGDQDGMDDTDWRIFNRTGLTHLVSISGSHITMLAGAAALAVRWLWCRLSWRGRLLAEYWPARRAAACAALITAWLYCLLAGWGVPARRTFMMLAVVVGAQALQLRLSASRVLALAAAAVVALDPWSILAGGFWLSFAAVAVLLAVGQDVSLRLRLPKQSQSMPMSASASAVVSRVDRCLRGLRLAARLQWAITLALAPALAWVFHEISLVSPLANAYAIPLIELCITPLSLVLAAVSLMPGLDWAAAGLAWLAHGLLSLMMRPTEWLAGLPTWPVAAGPAWMYLLAVAGAACAVWPNRFRHDAGRADAMPAISRARAGSRCEGLGLPTLRNRWAASLWHRRRWAWLALLPMVFWTPPRPADGEWDLHALDVGQGSALLLRTARHAVVFDVGARHAREADEGARTVVPALRALGVRWLDALIASHADLDHAGGMRSVLESVPVEQTFSSFDLDRWLDREASLLQADPAQRPLAASPCLFGGRWRIDGVSFEFLWPLDVRHERKGAQSNAGSCVLRVRGKHHSLLLTGDIDARTEAALVQRGLTQADVVVAAHHGSRSSSSVPFVQAVAAQHVIVQVGRWNRHGHPADAVLDRWRQSGAAIWRTDWQGGINARSRSAGLSIVSVLESSRRYWHGQRP